MFASIIVNNFVDNVSPKLFVSLAALLLVTAQAGAQDWPEHGGDKGGRRYSPLAEITPENIGELRPAWTYRTGEPERRGTAFAASKDQNIPLLVAGNLIVCTPFNRIVALDPTTGTERWVFDAEIALDFAEKATYGCRGVAYWQAPELPPGQPCRERIIFGTNDLRLFAIDANSGKRCGGFGVNGEVAAAPERPLAFKGELAYVNPPVVVNGVIVLGSSLADDYRTDSPSGKVRAFDALTGAKSWEFDPIPKDPNDPASASWHNDSALRTGSANTWGNMAVDEARDLVFLPTSTPAVDYYGGERPGNNDYANSLVALRGASGEVVWHFQILHDSIWDYDVPSQPLLVDLPRDGELIPAVVQNTKQGLVFVFHRETGEPLFPIEERPVPVGDVPGEWYSPTQPFPVKPPPLVPHGASPDDAWGFVLWDKWQCRKQIESVRYGPIYTPVSLEGTIISPWTAGGANWGGPAYDPSRHWMIINTSRMMKLAKLVPVDKVDHATANKDGPIDWDPPKVLRGTPYALQEATLLSPFGAPCNKPPWGGLTAVDLVSGEIVWEVPLGSLEDYLPIPIEWDLGTPNIGGPIVTAGGLIFIAATMDGNFRAFNVATGKELWKVDMPAGTTTTPITYAVDGKQYVVIVSGGHGELPDRRGDYVLAFALP